MCFLKYLKTPPLNSISSSPLPAEKIDSDTQIYADSQQFSMNDKKQQYQFGSNQNLFLVSLLNRVARHSSIMFDIDQKLQKSQQDLVYTQELLSHQSFQKIGQNKITYSHQNYQKISQGRHKPRHHLTSKLFGNQQYKYRLALSQNFPDTLYKQRNFGFTVQLIDIQSGKQQKNGNLIQICLAVCDSQGEWIHKTKEGTCFIKGKLQTQLHHGEADFIKLSPKDVTRNFPNKTINLVIYPKPTVLRYSSESSLEESVDFENIQPLIIENVSVKAKKRE